MSIFKWSNTNTNRLLTKIKQLPNYIPFFSPCARCSRHFFGGLFTDEHQHFVPPSGETSTETKQLQQQNRQSVAHTEDSQSKNVQKMNGTNYSKHHSRKGTFVHTFSRCSGSRMNVCVCVCVSVVRMAKWKKCIRKWNGSTGDESILCFNSGAARSDITNVFCETSFFRQQRSIRKMQNKILAAAVALWKRWRTRINSNKQSNEK